MSVIQTRYPILNKITNYGTQIAANNVHFTSQINTINQRLSSYNKTSSNVTISQPLLGDQLYSLNLNSDPKQYVQCQDFINLKKVVLGIDLVNNFQSTLESMGGMDDLQKILKQKTDQVTQDDVNNLFILSVPVQSSSANQTTVDPKQYVTYYQYNIDVTRIDNKMACMLQVSGDNARFKNDVLVDGVLKNASSTLVPLNDNEYTTKYFSDQVQAEVQTEIEYLINQITNVDMNALEVDQSTVAQLDLGIVNWNINDVPVMKQTLSTYTKSNENVVISQPLLGDRVYTVSSTTNPRQYIQYQDFKQLQQVVLGIDVVNNFQQQIEQAGGIDDQLKLLSQKTAQIAQDDVNNLVVVTNPLQTNNSTQTTTNAKQYVTYFQYNTDLSVLKDKTNSLTHDSLNSLLVSSIPLQSSNDQQLATDAKQYVTYYQHNYNNQLLIDKTYCMSQDQGQHCQFRGNVQVPGAITNTNSSLVPLNLNEYVTKYYVDQQKTQVQTALSQYSQQQDLVNTDVQSELQYIVSQISNTSQIQYQPTSQTYTLSNLLIQSTLSNDSSVLVPQADNEYITKYYMQQQLLSLDRTKLTGVSSSNSGTNFLNDKGQFVAVSGGSGSSLSTDANNNINVTSAGLTTGQYNLALGQNSLNSVTTGMANLAIGISSLQNNTSGNANLAIGYVSLQNNTSGQQNLAIGIGSLNANTTGSQNMSIGLSSMELNTEGQQNLAIGFCALKYNIVGNCNLAIGSQSLFVTTGSNNTGLGMATLVANRAGNDNTALGYQSLFKNILSNNNTSIGSQSGYNTTSANNTFIGRQAGYNNTTFSNCTFVGHQAGSSMNATADNQIWLGTVAEQVYGGTYNNISDQRDKAEIRDTQLGLDFVNKLRPVDYKWNNRSNYVEQVEVKKTIIDSEGKEQQVVELQQKQLKNDESRKGKRFHHGLIAQEVQEVIKETGVDFGGFQDHTVNGGSEQMTLGYYELIGPLIKAVQQLSQQVTELKQQQHQHVNELKQQHQQITELKQQMTKVSLQQGKGK